MDKIKELRSLATGLISTLRNETVPIATHTDPQAIEDCFDELRELFIKLHWMAVIQNSTLREIAAYVMTIEADTAETEEAFGLDVSEVVEMAHNSMILMARRTLTNLFPDGDQSLPIPVEDLAE